MFQSFDATADGTKSAARVAALRAEIIKAGVEAIIVPRGDAHQGENVAPRHERLAWLSGFTGSAGTAVVLSDRAALFVDGRYTLQAAQQCDDTVFEIVPTHEITIAAWLSEAMPEHGRIGYDPWLHGSDEIRKLQKQQRCEVVALEANPIDAIWEDQPPPPLAAAIIQPEHLAGERAASKRERIAALLSEGKADWAILSLPESIAWLLNIRGSDIARTPIAHAFALIASDARVRLFIEPEKIGGDVRAHLGSDVTVEPPSALLGALAELEGKRVRVDAATCPLALIHACKEAGAELDCGQDPCLLPKAIKNDAELAGARAAHRRDGAAMVRFLCWLDGALDAGASLTEIDIVERLEEYRRDTGELMDIAFDTICGSGPNGAIVHYRVTTGSNRKLVPGDLLLIDSGGQYRDGTTDITRTIATGPVPADATTAFTLVLKGMIAVSRARWPKGLTGREIDVMARMALWRAGLDYDHGTGHGVGAYLGVHEGPQSLSRRGSTVALEPGMIVSNEPGYYRTGAFGIRIENLVAVTPAEVPAGGERAMLGFETLTLAPVDRRLIRADMLDREERSWLDAYHARVEADLTEQLGEDAAAWLARACAPI